MRGMEVKGDDLRTARVSRGMTQEALADASGLDVKTVRKAEQGKRLDFETIARLARTLDVEISSLLQLDRLPGNQPSMWRDVVLEWKRAFEERDIDALVSIYHPEGALELPGAQSIPFGGTARGREAIEQTYLTNWKTVTQARVKLEDMTIFLSDQGITLRASPGAYRPDGQLVYFPCLHLFTFRDNLIFEHHVEFDSLEFAKQFSLG